MRTAYYYYYYLLSGEVFVAGGLDREDKDVYHLNISATDTGVLPGPLETVTMVTIHLSDSNDNPPMFSQSVIELNVRENMPVGSRVGDVLASDPDLGANAAVQYYMQEAG